MMTPFDQETGEFCLHNVIAKLVPVEETAVSPKEGGALEKLIERTFSRTYPFITGETMKNGVPMTSRLSEGNMIIATPSHLRVLAPIQSLNPNAKNIEIHRVNGGTPATPRAWMANLIISPPDEEFIVIEFQKSTRSFINSLMLSTKDVIKVCGLQAHTIYRQTYIEWMRFLHQLKPADRTNYGKLVAGFGKSGALVDINRKTQEKLEKKYPHIDFNSGLQRFPPPYTRDWGLMVQTFNAVELGLAKPAGDFSFLAQEAA